MVILSLVDVKQLMFQQELVKVLFMSTELTNPISYEHVFLAIFDTPLQKIRIGNSLIDSCWQKLGINGLFLPIRSLYHPPLGLLHQLMRFISRSTASMSLAHLIYLCSSKVALARVFLRMCIQLEVCYGCSFCFSICSS